MEGLETASPPGWKRESEGTQGDSRAVRTADDELNRRAWTDTLPRLALRPAALDTARYTRFAKFLEQQGLTKPPPPVDTYAIQLPR